MKFIIPFFKFSLFESDESKISFQFDELSPDIQEKVLNDYRETHSESINDWWYEDVIENFESELKNSGLEDIECNFTGFWSQGDGASFTANVRDVEKFLRDEIRLKPGKWFDYQKEEKEEDEIDALISGFEELGINSKIIPLTPDDFWIAIKRDSSRYCHENTISTDLDVDEPVEGRDLDASQQKEFNAWLESLENSITEWARKKSRELYSELENEYESMTSDEAIQEWIDSMGYEFTRDGEKID
jgi:hypothetical protein